MITLNLKQSNLQRRLPEARDEAVAHVGDVVRPVGMSGEYSLFGMDAVEQGHPARRHQQQGREIPLLQVVADIREQVRQIDRMAYETVGACRGEAAQRRADPEPSAQGEEAGEAQKRRERHQDEAARLPCGVAGNPAKIRHLGVGVGVRHDDSGARRERVIVRLGWTACEGDAENHEMLRYVDPVYEREGGRQRKQEGQLRQRDAEKKIIRELSRGYPRDVQRHVVRSSFRQQRGARPEARPLASA
jgi:hypothetical protein